MKKNIGSTDRIVRFLIAIVAILIYNQHILNGTAAKIVLVFGMLMFVTAFMRFCPLYPLLHISSYKPEADFKMLLSNGATVIDVREPNEFSSGHIDGSINIPLSKLSENVPKLKDKTIITCCASGVRSAMAKKILVSKGITAYNGGGWRGLQQEIGK